MIERGAKEAKCWMAYIKDLVLDQSLLDDLVIIFSDIFFVDKIRYPITIQWESNLAHGTETVYGEVMHLGSETPGHDQMWIRIDPNDTHQEKGFDNADHAFVSTLANELMHAYLQSYCCAGAHEHGNLKNKQVCRRSGNEEGPIEFYVHHFMAWFFLASRVELCFPSYFGFEANFVTFEALVKNFRVHDMRMTAGDWKLFFMYFDWEEVCKLLDRLDKEDFLVLIEFLREDRFVMQVFADEGLKH